ncbi:unnamed protein product [Protopolystoma xenopodis]|uniref:Uncharacterized protein n=1 Tax=Protopolystoma xenopodis TaxID=117903 RepID=A0A3S5BW61_9PLAT|nr:unnamed protein product [Protopolystoma xenopodis]
MAERPTSHLYYKCLAPQERRRMAWLSQSRSDWKSLTSPQSVKSERHALEDDKLSTETTHRESSSLFVRQLTEVHSTESSGCGTRRDVQDSNFPEQCHEFVVSPMEAEDKAAIGNVWSSQPGGLSKSKLSSVAELVVRAQMNSTLPSCDEVWRRSAVVAFLQHCQCEAGLERLEKRADELIKVSSSNQSGL